MAAENVKVIVRCRPMNKKEQDLNCQCVVKMKNCMVETWDPNEGPTLPKQFTFDSTYDQNSQTENIYNDICYPLVESVLDGYNATIFVYGQTGCGKSYTMEGTKSGPQKGVISRAFEHIFEAIAVTTGVKYLALISYLEIYNEQIRDLLIPQTDKSLNLKESPTEGVTVPGLTTHPVHNATECEHYLNLGSKNRIIGATLMNQNSSRSHSIFTISIEQISSVNNNNNNENESIRKGKLNLVDLAGSERQAKTGATGDRLKEATKINLSLSALGNVISALVDGKAKHIPYRDSKLTRLLQDSLGGNTKTLMIACISPASRDYVETLSTLRYANRAKNISNKPKVNEDPKDTMLRQYQNEIERLKALLAQQPADNIMKSEVKNDLQYENDEENEMSNKSEVRNDSEMRIRYEQEMEKLKNLHENEKMEKETVLKQMQNIKDEIEVRKQHEIQQSKEEIVNRIEELKKALIGGEKANDEELSERRKRKKAAAEKRASVIAHLLAKIDMNEDRELLHNQYKDISQELSLKTEALRKYRHKVKALEKEIVDIQSEFETERQDYLETVRKQDQQIKMWMQIAEKISGSLKKECNYSDLERIKEQCVWMEDGQKYKLPEMVTSRTKLPPPGRFYDTQTAPARLSSDDDNFLEKKLEKSEKDDIITSYFQPTTKRAAELLSQSSKIDPSSVFNTWRDFARRNKPKSTEEVVGRMQPTPLSNSFGSLAWMGMTDRKPLRLDALPNIDQHRNSSNRQQRLDSLEY